MFFIIDSSEKLLSAPPLIRGEAAKVDFPYGFLLRGSYQRDWGGVQSQGKLSGALGLSGDWGGCRIRPSPWSFCPPASLDMTPHSHSLACRSSSLPSDLVPAPEGVKVTAGLQLLNPPCISGAGPSPAGASFSSRPSPSLSGSNLGAQRSSSGAHMRGKWGCPPVRALLPRSASRCSSRRALPRCFLHCSWSPGGGPPRRLRQSLFMLCTGEMNVHFAFTSAIFLFMSDVFCCSSVPL